MLIYGIDPGVTGAIALLVDGRLEAVADLPAHAVSTGTVKRRLDAAGLAAIVRDWRARHGVDAELAVVERVGSMPGQGVASVFSLGRTAGVVEAVLLTLGVPVEYAVPGTWKRAMGLTVDKSASQAVASRMFPRHAGTWSRAKDHNRAEAALLAAWGWRTRR
jgi:crossover junction endodeoxyribonuclease RuvC